MGWLRHTLALRRSKKTAKAFQRAIGNDIGASALAFLQDAYRHAPHDLIGNEPHFELWGGTLWLRDEWDGLWGLTPHEYEPRGVVLVRTGADGKHGTVYRNGVFVSHTEHSEG